MKKLLLLCLLCASRAFGQITDWIDPQYFNLQPWGTHSYWIRTDRSYLATPSAFWFTGGIGVDVDPHDNPSLMCQMLAKYGVKHSRLEYPWSSLDYTTGAVNDPLQDAYLLEMKNRGIRPVILLNGNSGNPCPSIIFTSPPLAADVYGGASSMTFTGDISSWVPFYTGITTAGTGAHIPVAAINGQTVSLGNYVPGGSTTVVYHAGQTLPMMTLKYLPWNGKPGTAEYNNTLAGWKLYTGTVIQHVASIIGNGAFDLEVWNELSNGSLSLAANNYWNNTLWTQYFGYSLSGGHSPYLEMVQAVAAECALFPTQTAGTHVIDGFGNTIPWTASQNEPSIVYAISKHPYCPKISPTNPNTRFNLLNAQLVSEPAPNFAPATTLYFPEYFIWGDQNENSVRDLGPWVTGQSAWSNIYGFYGTNHGRDVRGVSNPCYVVATETGGPRPMNLGVTDTATSLNIKAKSTMRWMSSWLHAGAPFMNMWVASERAASNADFSWSITSLLWQQYCQSNTVYPADDSAYVSPALKALSNLAYWTTYGHGTISAPRSLSVVSVSDTHNNFQWQGDGTAAHPNLYDRDCLEILPWQCSDTRFAIHAYVATQYLVPALAAEAFTITLQGVNSALVQLKQYDPILNTTKAIPVTAVSSDTIQFTVNLSDYPNVLELVD